MKTVKGQKMSGQNHKTNGDSWQMWGITLFGRGMKEVLKMAEAKLMGKEKNYWIATVNPEFMMVAEKNPEFKGILERTSLNVVDGIGLIWAKKVREGKGAFRTGVEILRGKYKEELVTGADLMDKLCGLSEAKKKTVYFYGGWNDRSKRSAEYFLKKYPKLKVAGYRAEDFDFKTEVDILFVARAMKKQEEWIDQNLDKLKTKIVMGLGRSFDYYSGDLKRAPKWMRKMGLEWLYSLYKEPRRWRRQLALPQFIRKVLVN
jgi:N-acetylglucosaminyldiphosphoundecaprenol N-acetyl-beta-D-mannosaminyltransferase